MKRLFLILVAGFFAQLTVSCYPDGPDTTSDYDVAMSTYNRALSDTFWQNLLTFAMPDSVVYVTSSSSGIKPDTAFNAAVLAQVRSNFEDRGYVYSNDSTEAPSFVVTVTAYAATNYYVSDWSDYWGWYPGWSWWWPYYDTSWYPYYSYVVSYNTGSLVIDMLQPTTSSSDSTLTVLWSGIADGILSGSTTNILSRTELLIDQCFQQSPNLNLK